MAEQDSIPHAGDQACQDTELENGIPLLDRTCTTPSAERAATSQKGYQRDETRDYSNLGLNRDENEIWRWFIVAAAFVMSFMFGMERTLSLYYVELMDYFETDSSIMSLIGSVFYTFYCFSGIIVLPLSERYGARVVIMTGGLFLSIGLMASAFAPNVYVCIGTFGFFLGTGCAMTYMNASSIVLFYFAKRRALAQGIGTSGQAAGGMILPILIQYLNEKYSWRGGLIILSGVALNVCVAGALVRSVKTTDVKSTDRLQADDIMSRDKDPDFMRCLKELLCYRAFILICFQSAFVQASISITTMHMKALVLEKTGVSDEIGNQVILFYCAALFIGLIVTGILANVTGIEPMVLLQVHFTMCAIGSVMIPVFGTFYTIIVFICVFAYNTSVTAGILPLVICKLVGEHRLRLAWGIRYFFCGTGGLIGPTIAGFLHERTKDYSYSMYVGGCGLFLSIFLTLEPCIVLIKSRRKELSQRDKVQNELMWRSISSLPGSNVAL